MAGWQQTQCECRVTNITRYLNQFGDEILLRNPHRSSTHRVAADSLIKEVLQAGGRAAPIVGSTEHLNSTAAGRRLNPPRQ